LTHQIVGLPVQPPAEEQLAPAPSRGRRIAKRAARAAAILFVGYYVFSVLLMLAFRFVNPPVTGVQLERRIEAALAGEDHAQERRFVAYERLPRHVPRAIMAAEDGRFLTHWGYDLGEMRKASAAVFDGEIPRGASTITQQLMKNLFGCTCRNPVRKVYDLTLTPAAELILGKERILELYLNNVEWGPGIFGIEAAARHHYGTSARRLSRSQAAGLAALLPNPLARTPGSTPQYRAEILRRMSHRGW
jgi:monofunctional biosynthetic peptidoglycan transglycosylase